MQADLPEPFDETLSNDVSLSQILDAFIIEEERPSIIVSFLETHDADFKSIIVHSLRWTRLFQLDFVLQCSEREVSYLLKKLKYVPGSVAAYCCWQICKSESGTSHRLKWMFKKEMNWILSSFKTRHPYSHISAKAIAQTDLKLFRACAENRFADAVSELSDEEFKYFMSASNCSIFKFRLNSVDVFIRLDPIKQWLFLKEGNFFENSASENVLWQILATDSIDDEVKIAIFDKLEHSKICNKISESLLSYVEESKSWSELMLKVTLDGHFNMLELAKTMLRNRKWKLLSQWAEQDAASLDAIFKVSKLVQRRWLEEKARSSLKRKLKKGK